MAALKSWKDNSDTGVILCWCLLTPFLILFEIFLIIEIWTFGV